MIYIVLTVILATIAYSLLILPTQWVKLEHVRHPLGLGKRVLQISDLHVEMLRVSPERLRRLILKVKPDYIFLTGDYIQSRSYLSRVDRYLKVLQESGIPVYAVLGNHDYRLKSHLPKLLSIFQYRGIHILVNESVELGNFQLVGIDEHDKKHADIRAAFRKVRDGKPLIIIAHDPNIVLKLSHPFDYLMAGHLHGGQLRLPFVFHYVDKGQLPKRGIIQGKHQGDYGTIYISRGIGQVGVNCRFLMRSEITLHDL